MEYKGADKFNAKPFQWVFGQAVMIDQENKETFLIGKTLRDHTIIDYPSRTTNRFDMHGNEIFGGDIIKKHRSDYVTEKGKLVEDYESIGVVVYQTIGFEALDCVSFEVIDDGYPDAFDDVLFYISEMVEVLGNVFEHKSLYNKILNLCPNKDEYKEYLENAKFY